MRLTFYFIFILNFCFAEPIEHTVFFKLHHEAGSPAAHAFHREAIKLGSLPGVENFKWVKQVSAKNDFDYGLTMTFQDEAAYKAYDQHPLHVKFVQEIWIPNVSTYLEIDWIPSPWMSLLDENLSAWEIWTGVPHKELGKLPDGIDEQVSLSDDGRTGTPVGLSDPFGIFTVSYENGEPVLAVSGEVYAGLTSLEVYSDYHLTMEVKWGEAKYAPRSQLKRDSGVLYHCYDEHGQFWNVWKRSLELQIQEGDMGDLYQLAGPKSTTRTNDGNVWDPTSEPSTKSGHVIRQKDHESPNGEWTRIDLYVMGDRAIHMVNGEIVLALESALNHKNESLIEGQIQIQSEGAEVYYRDIRIRSIDRFPSAVASLAFPM